ncbi:DUF1983 domain-containing protein, partial [Escherichia coli]|nr:DUF1983 domain-containing protein [Escherichia coli]
AGIGAGIEDADGQPLSNILLQADRIAMINPENGNTTPLFVAQGNQLFMNDVFLKRLFAVSITSSGEPPTFSLTPDGKLTARNADISGNINANSGTLNNVVIAENCTIKGTLRAENIIGDVVKTHNVSLPALSAAGDHRHATERTVTVIDDQSFDRNIVIPPVFYSGIVYQGSDGDGATSICTLTVSVNDRVVFSKSSSIGTGRTSGGYPVQKDTMYPGSSTPFSYFMRMASGGGDVRIKFRIEVIYYGTAPGFMTTGIQITTMKATASGFMES